MQLAQWYVIRDYPKNYTALPTTRWQSSCWMPAQIRTLYNDFLMEFRLSQQSLYKLKKWWPHPPRDVWYRFPSHGDLCGKTSTKRTEIKWKKLEFCGWFLLVMNYICSVLVLYILTQIRLQTLPSPVRRLLLLSLTKFSHAETIVIHLFRILD